MGKHAYLIMAYHQWELLEKLIGMLDDERNDVFIHVDKKIKNVPFDEIANSARRSRIFFAERNNVHRLTFDLYEVTLNLLKTALRTGEYSYFHLITGQDLPLKNQDYVHDFFDKNEGKNFIDVVPLDLMKRHFRERISLYHFMVPYLAPNSKLYWPAKVIEKLTLTVQNWMGVNRIREYEKQGYQLRYGSAWFSITKEFAEFLTEKEEETRKVCKKWTYIPEESIPQSLLWNSRFRDSLFEEEWIDHDLKRANLRMIFWSGKTSPETITMEHVKLFKDTPNLFARKFDIVNHRDAVEAVERMVRDGE